MPLNPAEKNFFDSLAQQENNPRKDTELSLQEFRAGADFFLSFTGDAADVKFKDQLIPVRDGATILARTYNYELPEETPALFFYPGCGYLFDLFEANAIACSRIAKFSNIKVTIVNFRLAPEYPLPQSILDAYDVTKYIAEHHEEFGIDPSKVFIGGVSSGAHCSAAIATSFNKPQQFNILHQILVNGCFDLAASTHDYDDYEQQDKICTRETISFIYKNYGIDDIEYLNPIFSPYYATDFINYPNTTIIVAEYDGIRNDSEAYYSKLHGAGVNVDKIVTPGQTHNTLIMRKVLSDGIDPAEVIANVIKEKLANLV